MANNDYITRRNAMNAACSDCYCCETIYEFEDTTCPVKQKFMSIPAADVEPKRKWIPVTERLPEERISPLTGHYQRFPCVFKDANGERELRYYKFWRGHFRNGLGLIMDEYVTHWAEPMSLPELPKEEENAE